MRTAGLILTFNTIEHFVVPVVDLENYIYILLSWNNKSCTTISSSKTTVLLSHGRTRL